MMEYCLDEGISLSTISQRRMSASFDRRLPSSLERRLSGQGKQHLGEFTVLKVFDKLQLKRSNKDIKSYIKENDKEMLDFVTSCPRSP